MNELFKENKRLEGRKRAKRIVFYLTDEENDILENKLKEENIKRQDLMLMLLDNWINR